MWEVMPASVSASPARKETLSFRGLFSFSVVRAAHEYSCAALAAFALLLLLCHAVRIKS